MSDFNDDQRKAPTDLLDIPEVMGYVDQYDRVVILCYHCYSIHWHGQGFGHRSAHCSEETPYSRTGYIIVPGGNVTDDILCTFNEEERR